MAYIGKTPSQATRARYYFTATGGETSLSGADDNGNTLVFSDGNYVDVMLNGVNLVAGTDYNTTTANTIGGLTALTADDVVEIVVYDTFSVFSGNVNSNFSVGGDISTEGDLKVEVTSGGIYTITGTDTATNRTLTLPDEAGTVLTSASSIAQNSGPAFSAYNSVAQFLAADVLSKVTFDTELFDTNSNFASSRFTPTVAGYYQLSCGVRADGSVAAIHAQVRLNNASPIAQGSFTNNSLNAFMSSCSGLAYLNGTTDYVEVYCYNGTSGGGNTNPGVGTVYFQGAMVRAA